MKYTITLILSFSILLSVYAQNASLEITTGKTTSLIFPFPVRYVDRGSGDILVQQVKEAGNILLVKASTPGLRETNLTVITGDGSVYGFKINYKEDPVTLIWQVPVQGEANEATYANAILDNPRTMHGIRAGKLDVFVSVTGIYIRKETMYYQLQLVNRSTIDYSIDHIHFTIRDRKKSKRTASQELELFPAYKAGNTKFIKAGSQNNIVVALPKFTIPGAKILVIQVGEKNGGRNLSMRVRNRNIIKAIPLPGLQ